jgi:hypothetical protein
MGPLILVALAGLGIGIWLGLPGRYTQSADEIEDLMESGGGRPRRVKRTFTPLAWMQRKAGAKSSPSRQRRGSRTRSGFSLEAPDDS